MIIKCYKQISAMMEEEPNILIGPDFKSDSFSNGLDKSLDVHLLDVIRQSDDRVYMIDSGTGQKLTLSEYVQQSYNLAAQLQNLGCKSGTIVGIISENRLEFPTVILAAIMTGATITCFNPAYTTVELQHVMGISLPTIMFCSSKNYDIVKQSNETVSCIKQIILLDTEEVVSGTRLLFSDLIKPTSNKYFEVTNRPDDTMAILYSSGTTGLPKGVMLSHRNMVFMLKLVNEEKLFDFSGNNAVGTLPMFHAYGFFVNLITINLGQTLIIMRQFERELFLSIIQLYKIKFLYLVPTLVVFLLKDALVHKYDLSSVEQVLCGAATLKHETEKEIFEKLKLKYLHQGYGLTESTLLCLFKNKESTKIGTCGSVVPGTKLKVVHLETGSNLGVNEVGEICVKGPHIMKGYYRNIKATVETIDDKGWLHTGDIGYYDEDGDVFIIDRLKDLIKYKGFQVAPAELEALLLTHPQVYDAAVIGIPDEVAGEIPTAFIVRKAGSNVTENELIRFIADMVSSPKRLRGGVTFIEDIPKNPSGKILRRELRKRLKTKLDSKY